MANQTTRRVSYSVGTKMNIGNYESADFHISESIEFDVTGETDEEIDALAEHHYDSLRERVDERLNTAVAELREELS